MHVVVGRFMADMQDIGTRHLGGRCCHHHHNTCFSGAQCEAGEVLDLMVRPTTEETEVVGLAVLAFCQKEFTILT